MGSDCERMSSFRTRSVCIRMHFVGVEFCVTHLNKVHAESCCHMMTVFTGEVAWNLDNLTSYGGSW